MPGNLLLFEAVATWRLRGLIWFLFAYMVFALVAANWAYLNVVTNDDGGVAAESHRLLLACFVAGSGMPWFFGMWLYLYFYVTRLELAEDGETLLLEHLTLFGRQTRTLRRSQLRTDSSYHKGELRFRWLAWVIAPWYWFRVDGARNFLLDAQGHFVHGPQLDSLLDIARPPDLSVVPRPPVNFSRRHKDRRSHHK